MDKKFILNIDYVFRDVLGEAVLANTKTKLCITLNETGTFVVKSIINGKHFTEILDEMTRTFDINHKVAKQDLENFTQDLLDKGILTID